MKLSKLVYLLLLIRQISINFMLMFASCIEWPMSYICGEYPSCPQMLSLIIHLTSSLVERSLEEVWETVHYLSSNYRIMRFCRRVWLLCYFCFVFLLFFVIFYCRYVDINTLYNRLGHSLCKAFPAFPGSDYSASFKHQGKIRPLKLLEKDEDMQAVFGEMGKNDEVTEGQYVQCEKCMQYAWTKENDFSRRTMACARVFLIIFISYLTISHSSLFNNSIKKIII